MALAFAFLVKEESYLCTICNILPNPPVFVKPEVHTPTIFAAGIFVKFAAVIAGSVPVTLAAGIFVKFAAVNAGNVPVILAAGILVKFAALAAGNVAGKRASAIVPVKFAAAKLVKFAPLIAGNAPVKFAAGRAVRFAPLPARVVAVHTPVKNTSPSGLIVHALPTLTFPELSIRNLSVPSFV